MLIVLDTFPVSCTGSRPAKSPSLRDRCHQWITDCEAAGHRVLVPAICYYEALRELELLRATSQIARLRAFCLHPQRFLPLATNHLEVAAGLWGQARRTGQPTADRHALDGDVILAAQAISLGIRPPGLVVATTNPAHISRYIAADLWTNIDP